MREISNGQLSRRDFVRLSALFLGGVALNACSPIVPTPVPERSPAPPPTPQLKQNPVMVEPTRVIEVVRDTRVSVTVGDKNFGYYGSSPDLYKDRFGNQGFSMGPSDSFLNLRGVDRPESYRVTDEKIEGDVHLRA